MIEDRQLTVLGRYLYESIPTITQFVAESATAAGLRPDEVFHCQMAADEACTNVFEHAYKEQADGNIEITCKIGDGICTIIIVDHGESFDPTSVPIPALGRSIDEVEPGGIGLHLMRKLMDEVSFEFGEDGNQLTMIKRRQEISASEERLVKTRRLENNILLVSVHGRLDAPTAPEVENTLRDLLESDHIKIIVDLSEVSYISSRGLKSLVVAWKRAGDLGGKLVLAGIQSRVYTIFDTVGFTEVFEIFDSVEAGVEAL